ncbi:MAG: alpha/beta fold hydrolase [Myxococcaceae bacterium]
MAAAFSLAGCQYMPHAYEPNSPQIPDARTVPLPGAMLTFTSLGSGQPIVFVHGNIADLRIWDAQRGPAFKAYQQVAYSRRYHYPNAWTGNGSDYTEANNVQDLVNLLRELHLGRVHLVGHGQGAQLAVEVALGHPEFVRTLVLVEPEMAAAAAMEPDFGNFTAERAQLYQQMETALRLEEAEKAGRLLYDWASASTGAYDALPPPLKGEVLDNASILGFFLSAPPPPMPCPELASLKVPTLVVTGERTNPFFSAVGDAVAHCIPNAVRETVPLASHVVQRENADAFNAILVGFLTTH